MSSHYILNNVLTCRLCFAIQDEDMEQLLATDFEIGHFIRERVVPRAVLYFTGEALEEDDDVRKCIVLVYVNHTMVVLVKERVQSWLLDSGKTRVQSWYWMLVKQRVQSWYWTLLGILQYNTSHYQCGVPVKHNVAFWLLYFRINCNEFKLTNRSLLVVVSEISAVLTLIHQYTCCCSVILLSVLLGALFARIL